VTQWRVCGYQGPSMVDTVLARVYELSQSRRATTPSPTGGQESTPSAPCQTPGVARAPASQTPPPTDTAVSGAGVPAEGPPGERPPASAE
jgi:hypothetical protein